MKTLRHAYATAQSATISIIFAVILTLWAELSPPFKALLASATGHHWTTKSMKVAGLFLFLWWLFYRRQAAVSEKRLTGAIYLLLMTSLAGIVIIILFYWWHSL